MGVTIYFWGQLAEITGRELLVLNPVPQNLLELSEELFSRYPSLKDRTFAISVNKKFSNVMETSIKAGDEVAFMPPFAGG